MSDALLEIEDLKVVFHGPDGRKTHAVDGVGFPVRRGRTLGIVGESGCGKSVTALAVMGLLPEAATEISGSVRFEGRDLLKEPQSTLRDLRGNRMAMVFQEPMTSLNPSYTVGDQIVEGSSAIAARVGPRRGRMRSRCCVACASPSRRRGSASIRTSCPAGCASG